MDLHEDFFAMLMVFLLVFGIAFGVLLAVMFQVDVWWTLTFTEVGTAYTTDTIPVQTQWDLFFSSMPINLLICIPIAAAIGTGVVALILD